MSYTRGEAAIDTCEAWKENLLAINPSEMTQASWIQFTEEMYEDLKEVTEGEDFSV